jgi:hypothetical protein
MTSRTSILEKTCTLLNEMIHIPLKCAMHLHDHWNKSVPFMKPFILVDFNNGSKIHNYTCWSINDIQSHHLLHQVNNHNINNKDLVLLGHVKISS